MKIKALYYALILTFVFSIICIATEKDVLELPFSIGTEYTVTKTGRDSINSPIPGAKPTTQITVEVTRDDKKAHIFYWDGTPLRDLGPMEKKESWPVKFLGEDAKISRTSIFMGQQQEVLVLHCKLDKYTPLMIYSKDMTKEEFNEMLGKMRRK